MSLLTVDEKNGRYQISKGITKSILEKLSLNPHTQIIQFVSPLADKEIELLESVVFSKRPDITLRVWGHYEETCDLKFIHKIPSLRRFSADSLLEAEGIEIVNQLDKLEHLGIGIYNLENFDFLDKVNPNLKVLYLQETKSTKPSIASIERFELLDILYLEGQQKGIEAISKLKNLKKVVLRSITTKNLDYLNNLELLWSVEIKLGGIKDFSSLTSLKALKYLELWQVQGLSELSFISEIASLQNLFIQSLKQLTKLPNFSNNNNLRRIYLENLIGLNDLSTLKSAPKLKEFIYILAENQMPENLIPALQNPSVEKVLCGFGSDKKNKQFDELSKQYNKAKYSYSDFQYE